MSEGFKGEGFVRRRREYSREFKKSAVELVCNGRSASSVANELGICSTVICRWVKESKKGEAGNVRVFPGRGNPRDEEVTRLRKENTDLREANEILKKAMAFFVEKPPR